MPVFIVAVALFLVAQAEAPGWAQFLDTFGVLGALVFVLWLILTQRLVPGATHREMQERADRGTMLAEKALEEALERAKAQARAEAGTERRDARPDA